MKRVDNWVDPLKRLIKDHEEVSEYLENLKEVVELLSGEKDWNKIKAIEDFFQRNIISHFKFEEEVIFPALLSGFATRETIKLILELQKEHGSMSKEVEEFQEIVSKNAFSLKKEKSERLHSVSKKIIDNFLEHAKKEDKNLLPILKEHRQILKAQEGI